MLHAVSITMAIGLSPGLSPGLGLAAASAIPLTPLVAAVTQADEGTDAFNALSAAYDAERNEFMTAYQAAEDDAAREALVANYPAPSAYFDRMKEIAERYAGTDAAAKACVWVIQSGGGEAGTEWASEMMMRDFFETERMADLCQYLGWQYTATAESQLDRLMTENPHRDVQARATYYRAKQMLSLAKLADAVSARAADENAAIGPMAEWYLPKLDDARKAALADPAVAKKYVADGEKLLNRVAEQYFDINVYGDKTLATQAKGDLFELHNLAIGCVAPDIEGVDANGESFQLSQYRGRVVVLDFWGFW